jgi:hypothetical protein
MIDNDEPSQMGTTEDAEEESEEGEYPFRIVGIDSIQPEYANLVHVNHDFYSFHVVFSRVVSPIFANNEDRERFAVDGWNADAVARLIIPAPAFREMVRFMQQHVDAYDRQYGGVADAGPASDAEGAWGGG